jgi:two-component system, OmpR family, sensor kinase
MGGLVDDHVMLPRLGQTQSLHVSQIDRAAIARDAAADFEVDAPDSVMLAGDEERIHQVPVSLLSNTTIHTPAGTKVGIPGFRTMLSQRSSILLSGRPVSVATLGRKRARPRNRGGDRRGAWRVGGRRRWRRWRTRISLTLPRR